MKRFILLLLFFLLTACSSSGDNGSTESVKIFPLTGVETNEEVNNRMVAVMINNSQEARPQTGLSKADLVFEILTEGNITRLLALYQSEYPEVVGPVRSAREYYLNLAKGHDAIYVYHGAASFIDDMIKKSRVEFLNGKDYDNDGHLFTRESFRKAPHNSYLQFTGLPETAENLGYDTTADYDPLPFVAKEELDNLPGESIHSIAFNYSNHPDEEITYVYDETEGLYNRFIGGKQTIELHTDEPVQLSNVFIIEASHELVDDEGRRTVDLTSGGNAYLLQQGKLQELEWMNDDGTIIPVIDGSPVGFVPGKTWVNVIPENPGLESVTAVQE